MEIDPQEIRRRYAELSDDGLLSIAREDLTELAQRYYDAELDERGLRSSSEGSPSESGQQPETNSSAQPGEEMVLVETFLAFHEADLARTLLQSADIPVSLENELGSAYAVAGGLRLMVPASFLEQAEEILGAQISDEELLAQAEAADSVEPVDDEDHD